MNDEPPPLVILAAGRGARLGPQAEHLHKGLYPLGKRPVLSRIIDQFPRETPLVIALGHLASQVRNFLDTAYPGRRVTCVTVDGYDRPGSGPGASLLACRPFLETPFYMTTVDTLILDPIPDLKQNWIGVSRILDPSRFCTVKVEADDRIVSFADKQPETENRLAFTGIAGICSLDPFWNALEGNRELIGGEKQLSNGLKGLLQENLIAEELKWMDTGTPENLETAQKHFEVDGFDFSKTSEHTYLIEDRAVKWFQDPVIAAQRARRAETLKPCTPHIDRAHEQFFSYSIVPGKTLYHCLEEVRPEFLFQWLKQTLWTEIPPQACPGRADFEKAMDEFYRIKTRDRLLKAFEKTGAGDEARIINNIHFPPIEELLQSLSRTSFFTTGLLSRFHGDLQFDNIIVTEDQVSPFCLIDWRQDFGGLDYGDRYYDLAKLNGGLSLDYAAIRSGRPLKFETDRDMKRVYLEECSNEHLSHYKNAFAAFCRTEGYDFSRVQILTGLIYLNMAALHAGPFDRYLLCFGQSRLGLALGAGTAAA